MPPASLLSDLDDSGGDQFSLTDQNVAILYQIITAAEQSPDFHEHPFRAIFSAYDAVLSQNGLDPHHDQIYLRFLFRLGDTREDELSLYQNFERLLDEFGIQIEFNTEGDEVQEVARIASKQGSNSGCLEEKNEAVSRWRQASSLDAYDVGTQDTSSIKTRAGSRSQNPPVFPFEVEQDEENLLRVATKAKDRTISDPSTPRYTRVRVLDGRMTESESGADVRHVRHWHLPRSQRNGHQLAAQSPSQIASRSLQDDLHAIRKDVFTMDSHIRSQIPMHIPKKEPASELKRQEHKHIQSRFQLFEDAKVFHSYRLRSVACDAVEKWSYAAIQAKSQHRSMDQLAIAYDTGILCRQAFEHWKVTVREKKQIRQTEQYFSRLEKRAVKVRDLMLQGKAFTHWSQCAQDEILQTLLVRKRVLCMKYFHIWKDLTVTTHHSNNVYSQRRLLGLWKQRYIQQRTNHIKGDIVYERSLQKRVYWNWFWAFCNRRAPEWYAIRLEQKVLLRWTVAVQANFRRHQEVSLRVKRAALNYFALQWRDKAIRALSNLQIAAIYRRKVLLSQAVQSWTHAYKTVGPYQQTKIMVEWRIAGNTFAALVNNFRLTKQADVLNRLRLRRETWTQWNDRLRWQTLAHKIDDRHLLETLYRWTIAHRMFLLERLTDLRLKRCRLFQLRSHVQAKQAWRAKSLMAFQDFIVKRSVKSLFIHWHSRCQWNQQATRVACNFRSPRISQEAFHLLYLRSQGIQAMSKMASDTAFYFVCKGYIRSWQNACLESKRLKRRNAYAQIRRRMKITLASEVIQRWRTAVASQRSMDDQAARLVRERSVRLAIGLFDHWKAMYRSIVRQQGQANEYHNIDILRRMLRLCIERSEELTEWKRIALVNTTMRVQNLAVHSLNKIRLRIIELKGPQATAENLQIRYTKRHAYGSFRLWQEKTASRLQMAITPPRQSISTQSKASKRNDYGTDRFDVEPRTRTWTGLEQSEYMPSVGDRFGSMHHSGHLSTPSKRAARAKFLARESTTPAGTPFQGQLRTTRRTLFGKSTLTRRNEFEATAEGSGSTTVVNRDE